MRITDLLTQDFKVSKPKYEQLLRQPARIIMTKKDGWEFLDNENTSETEAKRWVRSLRLIREYEKISRPGHGFTGLICFSYAQDDVDQEPDWPEELQPYAVLTTNILEAYFCHKFDIPF